MRETKGKIMQSFTMRCPTKGSQCLRSKKLFIHCIYIAMQATELPIALLGKSTKGWYSLNCTKSAPSRSWDMIFYPMLFFWVLHGSGYPRGFLVFAGNVWIYHDMSWGSAPKRSSLVSFHLAVAHSKSWKMESRYMIFIQPPFETFR